MSLALGFVAMAVAGTLARAVSISHFNRPAFPVGTVSVNVVGSFLLGLMHDASPEAVTVLGLAGLGSFTTFSTFAHEAVVMAEERRLALACSYLAVTVVAGVAAAALGIQLGP